jgi:hypothetical protein
MTPTPVTPEHIYKFRIFREIVQNIAALLAALFLGVVFLAQFDATPPVRFVYVDEHVDTSSDGRSFFLTRETCLDRDVEASALPSLRGVSNGLIVPLPVRPVATWHGCRRLTVLILIPEEVPAGEYEYLLTMRFKMNPFKTLDVQSPPVRLTVRE